MTTMYFNACPKCGGTLVRRHDDFGPFLQCMSCSRIVELAEPKAHAKGREKVAQKRAA